VRRADHASRGVLSSVVCLSVIVKSHKGRLLLGIGSKHQRKKHVYGLVLSVVKGKLYTAHPIYSYLLRVIFLFGFSIIIRYACYNVKIKCKYLDKDIISNKN